MGQARCKRCLAGDGRAWLCVWVCQQLAECEGRLQSITSSAKQRSILQDQWLPSVSPRFTFKARHWLGSHGQQAGCKGTIHLSVCLSGFGKVCIAVHSVQARKGQLHKGLYHQNESRTCMASSRVKSAIARASWHGPGCSVARTDEFCVPVGYMTCDIECMMANATACITWAMYTNTACTPCTLMCRW